MKIIKLTRSQIAMIDNEDFELVSKYKWWCSDKLYAYSFIPGPHPQKKVNMARLIMNCPFDKIIDHIDHNTLNNQKVNLQICSRRENSLNRVKRNNTSSIYKGVSWSKTKQKWITQIRTPNTKRAYIGAFDKEYRAAMVYDLWAKDLYGEFAKLNF